MIQIPQPSPEGIEKTKEVGRRKYGRDLTDGEAAEILSRFIRYAGYGMLARADAQKLAEARKDAPLGYRPEWKRTPEGRIVWLYPDGAVLPLVLKAFALRDSGGSLRKICAEMEAAGLRTRKGKRLGPTALMAVFNDARYAELRAPDYRA